ncbi:lipase family protein [Actinocorallia lasiicapitis]
MWLTVAVAAGVLGGNSAAGAEEAAGSVVPDQDSFYVAPADIAAYAPGAVVAKRAVTLKWGGLSDKADAWQISYRSNDSHDVAELAVTTVAVPKKGWTGGGARPVVSLQLAEDGTGTQCAPSYTLAQGGFSDAPTALFAPAMIDKGWAVAFPDFEGPKSVYGAGPQAGHAVLDGIRAVQRFGEGGLGPGNPWALSGYSGGAQATGWAAELQPSYAPELDLKGATMGGTPADLGVVGKHIDGGIFSGFGIGVNVSLMTEFPEAGMAGLLNAEGVKAMAKATGRCTNELLLDFAFKKMSDYTTVADLSAVPSVAAVLKRNKLGANAPTTPVYSYHAVFDEIVPVGQADVLSKAWCAKGTKVQNVRDWLGGHITEALGRSGDALAYLSDRFAGKQPPTSC